jgi:hypothetical protein
MSEIIAKSKTAKRERAKEKEADDEQLDALDLTFKALADVRARRSAVGARSAKLLHCLSVRRLPSPCARASQAGALRNSLRTSTGHLKPAARPSDRRRRGVSDDTADGDEADDFDALVRTAAHEHTRVTAATDAP